MLVGLVPAVAAVVGLNQIFGTGWPVAGKLAATILLLTAVLVVAWFAMYRWGDEKQRRDVERAARAAGRFVARVIGRNVDGR